MKSVRVFSRALVVTAMSASPAFANMGNLATNYGVLPADVASAQALSLFNSQISATYYNPSYLAKDTRGELTGALLHAEQDLQAKTLASNGYQVRNGNTLSSEPSQHVILGMKTDLTSLTEYNRPLYFGFVVGVEKYGDEMLAFTSGTAKEGQFFSYGREPLFLNLGGAMEVTDGLLVGAAARVTLHADATMATNSTLGGVTEYERLEVSATPSIRPILGVSAEPGKLFCGDSDCFLKNWEVALSWRGYSNTQTNVSANAVIPQTIDEPGLFLAINTLDSYQPDIIALGVQYRGERWRAGVTLEQQNWSDLTAELKRDSIKDQALLEFDDILIPRFGAEYEIVSGMFVTAGVAMADSPLKNTRSLDVNYFDNDKLIVGLGLAMEFADPPVLAFPLRMDFGYQYQQLDEREFQLTTTDPMNPSNPYETVSASGDVHIFTGSFTLKF